MWKYCKGLAKLKILCFVYLLLSLTAKILHINIKLAPFMPLLNCGKENRIDC